MDKQNRFVRFMQGKGFYAALALVVGGAALTSYFAVDEMLNTPGVSSSSAGTKQEETTWQQPAEKTEVKQNTVPKTSSSSSAPQSAQQPSASSQAQPSASQSSAAAQGSQAQRCVLPLADTNVLQAFSGDELVYNETLGDWRTHNGIDFAAKDGQAVFAPVGGKVVFAGPEDLWGTVVAIDTGKEVVRLCGLDARLFCAVGDTVAAGDTIAKVGSVAAEAALGAHVHIEVLQNDAYVNPATLLP